MEKHGNAFKELISETLSERSGAGTDEYLRDFPVIEDRAAWQELDPELKERICLKGRQALDTPYPPLLLSDFREFSRNGNRVRFEEKYFLRRRLLTSVTIAECVEDKGLMMDHILDGIWLLLEETTWCLPAHNTLIRDAAPDQIPDPEKPVIDLFAGETAAILGLSEYLLRARLEKISPVLSSCVNTQIRGRILEPYLRYPFWWKGDGVQQLLNWTPWITQNILIALFSRPAGFWKAGEKEAVLKEAAASLDFYLDIYGEDGCCDEGAQYFGHAGLSLFGCMDLLERVLKREQTVCGGDRQRGAGDGSERIPGMEALWHSTLIRNIASYIVKMYAGNGCYLNFADCSPFPGHRTARDFLFGKKTGEEMTAAFAAEDYRNQSWEERLLETEENLYIHLLQIFSHKAMMMYPGGFPAIPDAWFPSTGLMVARDNRFVLAAKAGGNAENHNHNDVGSIILYRDGSPLLIDLGVETYTGKTFSARRYEIWTMQSAYHNVPAFFDGEREVMQQDGPEYQAGSVRAEMDEERSSLYMDLAPAYPDPRIHSYHRCVTLVKNSRVELKDVYLGSLSCALTLMTYEKPSLLAKEIRVGNTGRIHAEGVERITIEECPIRDPRLAIAWKHSCYRIRLYLKRSWPGESACTVIIKGDD